MIFHLPRLPYKKEYLLFFHLQEHGKIVNIPSYQVAEGDEISIVEKSQSQKRITQALSLSEQREECEWVSVDKSKFTGILKNLPTRELLSSEINENYIVELYSR